MEFKKRFKYNLKESDAIEDLEGFPLEIIEKMIDKQVSQGNPPNVKVFQKRRSIEAWRKGFNWRSTSEGCEFWGKVIGVKKFDLFFTKYPKL